MPLTAVRLAGQQSSSTRSTTPAPGPSSGQGYILKLEWAELAYNSRYWLHETKLNLVYATGVHASGMYAYAAGRCYFGCGVFAAYPPDAWAFNATERSDAGQVANGLAWFGDRLPRP